VNITKAKRRLIGIAAEIDAALPVSASGRLIVVGTASETDASVSLLRRKLRLIGIASEVDTALPLAKAKARAVGVALESDAAVAIAKAKRRQLGIAGETDAALTLLRPKRITVGMATETDTALVITLAGGGGSTFLTAADRAAIDALLVANLKPLYVREFNRVICDPITGIMTYYDDDSVTPYVIGPIYEDAAGTILYRGTGVDHRGRLQ
jgi:hypothetical protein